MAKHLSIGSVIEKNKIASEETFLILIDAVINDEEGNLVNTIRFVKNGENIVFGGNTYQAANFEFDVSVENNTEPSIKLSAQDQTRTLAQYIEAFGGLVKSKVTMTVVNSGNLAGPPEMQETFSVISADVSGYVVEFNLGTESAVTKRFPQYRQFKDRCGWKYKGPRCKYAGPLNKCDYTAFGTNGCVAHANIVNYGGFLGLNGQE